MATPRCNAVYGGNDDHTFFLNIDTVMI